MSEQVKMVEPKKISWLTDFSDLPSTMSFDELLEVREAHYSELGSHWQFVLPNGVVYVSMNSDMARKCDEVLDAITMLRNRS